MLKQFNEGFKLLFTDTDALYTAFNRHRKLFDNSDYPSDFFFNHDNKKVIGKMKDEAAGVPILKVCLKSKIYLYELGTLCKVRNCKAITKGK